MLEIRTVDTRGNDLEVCKYHTIEDIVEDMKINISDQVDCYVYDPLLKRVVLEYIDGEIYDPLELLI